MASEEYLRSFWWFVAAVPAFGLITTIFADGALRVIGVMAILWPFSIPARSVLTTTKSSRLFTNGCHVELSDEELRFIGEYKNGKRLRYAVDVFRIKEVVRRRGMLLIRTRLPGFLPIREAAFESEADIQSFVSLLEKAIELQQEEELSTGSGVTDPDSEDKPD
jgi:hypothetical protein